MPQRTSSPLDKKAESSRPSSSQTNLDLGLGDWETQLGEAKSLALDSITPRQVMALQRMVGNQVVQRMLARPNTPTHSQDYGNASTEQEETPSISDGEATIQRTPAPKISSFDSSAGSTLVQRRMVLASKPGHYHQINGAVTGTPKEKIKAIRKAKRTTKYRRFDDIEIDDRNKLHITDGNNAPVWYRVKKAKGVTTPGRQYVLAEKVLANMPHPTITKEGMGSDPELETDSKTDLYEGTTDIVNEVDNAMVDVLRGYTLKEDLRGEELTDSEQTTVTDTTIAEGAFWAGGGAMSMVGGILGMASSLKDLMSNEKTTWEKVEATFNLMASGSDVIAGAYGVTGGVSQLVNSYSTEGTEQATNSEAVAGWAFGFQGMFGALSNGIKTILDVVSLVRMIAQQIRGKESFDKDEWIEKAVSLLTNALETAKGVVTTFRVIWELVNDAVTGVFENVVPGIDIAISAVKSIFQGYYLVKSAFHWFQMVRSGRKAKKDLKKHGFTKDSVSEARKFYGKRGGLIANTEQQIGKNNKGIAKRINKAKKTRAKSPSRFKFVNNRRAKNLVKWRKQSNERAIENSEMTDLKNTAQDEITKYESNSIDSEGQPVPLPQPSQTDDDSGEQDAPVVTSAPVNHPSRLQLSELNLTKELSSANAKRVLRQSIHIATNLVKIAGSIVTIVAGTGAPAGVALKAAAAGVDISLPFFRSLKQFGRNKAGKAKAKGKTNFFTKIFNSNKSTAAKLHHRKQQAVTILLMIADLNKMVPDPKDDKNTRNTKRKALQKRVQHIERYMYAAGVSPKKIYRANGKPAEQVKLLVEAMCKRELLS